jgi:tRNA pseudouridine55 synthase
VCSKGTYIRSIARDYGNALGVGAYLSKLCRTRIGSFRLEDAKEIADIA